MKKETTYEFIDLPPCYQAEENRPIDAKPVHYKQIKKSYFRHDQPRSEIFKPVFTLEQAKSLEQLKSLVPDWYRNRGIIDL